MDYDSWVRASARTDGCNRRPHPQGIGQSNAPGQSFALLCTHAPGSGLKPGPTGAWGDDPEYLQVRYFQNRPRKWNDLRYAPLVLPPATC